MYIIFFLESDYSTFIENLIKTFPSEISLQKLFILIEMYVISIMFPKFFTIILFYIYRKFKIYKNLYDLKDETDFYFSSISIIKIFPSEIPPEIIYFINTSLPLFNSVAFQIFLQKSFILIEKNCLY